MKAKKSLGQHFLVDKNSCQFIVNQLENHLFDRVMEVGPGRGALTEWLYPKYGNRLLLIEIDQDLIPNLQRNYPGASLWPMNFLKMSFESVVSPGEQIALIGNFPYNISSQIVFKMLKHVPLFPVMIGMFQREMAQRIIAKPGGKDYGVISVLTQVYYQGQHILDLAPDLFRPPPKVHSSVICLIRKSIPAIEAEHFPLFRAVVKNTFGQRRKMIRNTVKSLLPNKESLESIPFLELRPEQLSLEDFVHITKAIKQAQDEFRSKN